ncbi:MAG: hypothetical protein AAB403_22330 [Planctomycetota bacterium]
MPASWTPISSAAGPPARRCSCRPATSTGSVSCGNVAIDQHIVVRGNSFSVVGLNLVAITDGAVHEGRSCYVLKQGARFDLATWSVRAGSP